MTRAANVYETHHTASVRLATRRSSTVRDLREPGRREPLDLPADRARRPASGRPRN